MRRETEESKSKIEKQKYTQKKIQGPPSRFTHKNVLMSKSHFIPSLCSLVNAISSNTVYTSTFSRNKYIHIPSIYLVFWYSKK